MTQRDRRPRFRMVPDSFIDACANREITKRQFFLGCFLLRFASYKTGELSMTVAELAVRCGYGLSSRSLRRDLKALCPEWVEFEARRGQRTPYKFRIAGLSASADGPSPGHDLDNELPDSVQVDLPPVEVPVEVPVQVTGQAGAAKGGGLTGASDPMPVQVPAEVPVQVPLSTTSTTSTEGREGNASGEESFDQVLGKTTAPADSLPAWIASLPDTGERAFLAGLHDEFVVNDGGRWLEDDAVGGKRP